MDNQHRKIKGYRELNEGEIVLMNLIKTAGITLGKLVDGMQDNGAAGNVIEIDQRWLSIGKTDLQKGLMALTRAVARPEFF